MLKKGKDAEYSNRFFQELTRWDITILVPDNSVPFICYEFSQGYFGWSFYQPGHRQDASCICHGIYYGVVPLIGYRTKKITVFPRSCLKVDIPSRRYCPFQSLKWITCQKENNLRVIPDKTPCFLSLSFPLGTTDVAPPAHNRFFLIILTLIISNSAPRMIRRGRGQGGRGYGKHHLIPANRIRGMIAYSYGVQIVML